MIDPLSLLLPALVIGGAAALLWWLLIASEGVYLGRRVVIWLYDLYAVRYDGIKGYRLEHEHQYLSQPLMEQIAPQTDPLVLDVATGTGRMPLALLRHGRFDGRVIASDLSDPMLRRAADKLAGSPRAVCVVTPAERLPFPDSAFDVVTCLEALEFMTRREPVLAELMRVLRPGGLLLITNRINTRLMPGKLYASDDLVAQFAEIDAESVYIERWQVDYDLVWVKKTAEA
ncbi:MAG: methyltransferase domain-containing protein [Anaerolineae bacterium]|nr:methyltransferase domain-containing protein [Anaerolineae bacterium]NUQ05696.1 class I SAM-dependent methyltransferase [Anaerolineae bacterium]